MALYHSQQDELEPMSASSQCINSPSHLSLCILGIAESEVPIDIDKVMVPVRTDLMRVNSGFSSIVVRKDGKQWWKRVEVRFDNHVVVPTFPQGLSPESYTKHLEEYLSKIGLEKLPESRPLWELHIFKYPTKSAAGTLVFKMSHAIGDGFSIMGAVFSVLKRADNSSMPLKFPSSSRNSVEDKNICRRVFNFLLSCFHTVFDMVTSMAHTAGYGDDRSPVRSGTHLVESLPLHTTRITFSLEDFRQVKSRIGVTINDIVVGVIFYAVHLYSNTMELNTMKLRRTALVLLNTRMLAGYRNLEEMLKNDLWGNKFSFMHIPMPSYPEGKKVDLKDFVLHASTLIKRKKNPVSIYLNGALISLMDRLKGTEVASKYVYYVLKNTSFTISNLVGPTEKMAIADHPINSIYFTVTGSPQSLSFLVMSYNGKLTVAISGEKGFIDSELIASCMKKAFKKIYEESSP